MASARKATPGLVIILETNEDCSIYIIYSISVAALRLMWETSPERATCIHVILRSAVKSAGLLILVWVGCTIGKKLPRDAGNACYRGLPVGCHMSRHVDVLPIARE